VDGGKTLAEFQAKFAGVRYELVTSKSHDLPKGGEPPCDRFHAVFYLDRMVTNIDENTRLKDAFAHAHPYCDAGAKDAVRFFYGHRSKSKQRIAGEDEPLCVDALLAEAADSVIPAAPQDYAHTWRHEPPSVLHKGEPQHKTAKGRRFRLRNTTTRRKHESPTMLSGASRNYRKASGTAYTRAHKRTTPGAKQAANMLRFLSKQKVCFVRVKTVRESGGARRLYPRYKINLSRIYSVFVKSSGRICRQQRSIYAPHYSDIEALRPRIKKTVITLSRNIEP
jgi:hypothetical protein